MSMNQESPQADILKYLQNSGQYAEEFCQKTAAAISTLIGQQDLLALMNGHRNDSLESLRRISEHAKLIKFHINGCPKIYIEDSCRDVFDLSASELSEKLDQFQRDIAIVEYQHHNAHKKPQGRPQQLAKPLLLEMAKIYAREFGAISKQIGNRRQLADNFRNFLGLVYCAIPAEFAPLVSINAELFKRTARDIFPELEEIARKFQNAQHA